MTRTLSLVAGICLLFGGLDSLVAETENEISQLEHVTQELVLPPFLPDHEQTASSDPKVVQVRMVIEEKLMAVGPNGATIQAMTFEGSVPGPIIVVHQDDYVELTLVNPKANSLLHNIDFHAATGALGGGGLTQVSPGEEVVLRFKATKTGVFVYHCAPGGAMIPWHVVSGMNGAIMVLPRGGLKDAEGKLVKYDKAYYIGEQDYYLPTDEDGNYKKYPSPMAGFADMQKVMQTLTPTHVVFNGAVGALTGDNALTAKVGETVLFIHAQANRDTRPHLMAVTGTSSGMADRLPIDRLPIWKPGSWPAVPRQR